MCSGSTPRICPVELDREAARIIDLEINPVFHSHRLAMPLSCPFHSSHDRMQAVRLSTKKIGPSRVRCSFCQKEFTSSELMELHLEQEHADKIPSSTSLCFSDYCPLLGCYGMKQPEAQWKALLHKCREMVRRCVPDQSSPVHSILVSNLCSPFAGVAREREDGSRFVLQVLGLVFVGLCVVVFYIVLCLWRRETSASDDLPRSSWWKRVKPKQM